MEKEDIELKEKEDPGKTTFEEHANGSAIDNGSGEEKKMKEETIVSAIELQPPAKRQRLAASDTDISFGFNNESFSDHKLVISIEGQEHSDPTIVFVSKLVIAGKSIYFREHMTPHVTHVTLQPHHNIRHFIDIIKWMYTDSFDTTGLELLDIMHLCLKFKVKAALSRCASELTANYMTFHSASKFIENEIQMRRENAQADDNEFGGYVSLWCTAKQFIRDKFKSFTIENWTCKEFVDLSLEALKIVLSSHELVVGTENTVFAAYRHWIHSNFEERKQYAAQLLPLIRFPLLQHNYLLDVVRTEADLDYPEDAKKTFAKQFIETYVYHYCSPERREALREPEIPRRVFVPDLLATKFYWRIDKISQKKELYSDSFFLGGYYLYLLMQRKNMNAKGGGTIGLYMHLKLRESGLGQSFYLPLAFELLVRNKVTKKYTSPKGVYASPFTFLNRAWGYVDILGMTWEEFLSIHCLYNENDTLYIKASVAFKDFVPKRQVGPNPTVQ